MAEFLTTNGISYQIEKIIIGAKKELVLVSPYLQLSKTLFERLKDASNNDVKITIIYGKDELKPKEKQPLSELENLDLQYFRNLHAKCYFNESEMVITSMNMYEFSEKNNREMGVYISKEVDTSLYEQAVNETLSIIKSSESISLSRNTRSNNTRSRNNQNQQKSRPSVGSCIRCECSIRYDPSRPYCGDCFSVWVQFENVYFTERVCHGCGEYGQSSMSAPICDNCFNSFEKGRQMTI